MKYAIPLNVFNTSRIKLILVLDEKTFRVVRSVITLSGPIPGNVVESVELPYKEIKFPDEKPEWLRRIGEDSEQETARKANDWFFKEGNELYEEEITMSFVPKEGMEEIGPIFEKGDEKTLKELIQGIVAWIGSEKAKICITSSTEENGDPKISILPEEISATAAHMLAKVAFSENSFYGTRWEKKISEKVEKHDYLTDSWAPVGVSTEYTTGTEEKSAIIKKMVAWAHSRGMIIPSEPETE